MKTMFKKITLAEMLYWVSAICIIAFVALMLKAAVFGITPSNWVVTSDIYNFTPVTTIYGFNAISSFFAVVTEHYLSCLYLVLCCTLYCMSYPLVTNMIFFKNVGLKIESECTSIEQPGYAVNRNFAG